jgi:DNA topoisomerase VI subunit B
MTGPRTHFKRSLSADYFTEKELTGLIGCTPDKWHITILKELIDNSLDAAEQAQDHPVIEITVDNDGNLTVKDNGPGLPAHVVDGSLDFEFFISDKNGRVAPSRGQLGNALKCLFAVPLVTDGKTHVEIIYSAGSFLERKTVGLKSAKFFHTFDIFFEVPFTF